MHHNNKTYIIIETKYITDDMVDDSYHSFDSFRKSLDCLWSILKFNTHFPNTMSGYVKYTHEEILQFLEDNAADWKDDYL